MEVHRVEWALAGAWLRRDLKKLQRIILWDLKECR